MPPTIPVKGLVCLNDLTLPVPLVAWSESSALSQHRTLNGGSVAGSSASSVIRSRT
jgi:hypothetical protein